MIYSLIHEYSDAPKKNCKWSHEFAIEDEYVLMVYVYKNKKRLLKGIADRVAIYDFLDAGGLFFSHFVEGVEFPFAFPHPIPFAEIHLNFERIGGGYVAHEFMHLIQVWMRTKKEMDNEEYAPELMGRLTSEFWGWYLEQDESNG